MNGGIDWQFGSNRKVKVIYFSGKDDNNDDDDVDDDDVDDVIRYANLENSDRDEDRAGVRRPECNQEQKIK